ncbi:MAG: HAMP domain-containing histidine kinase [Armatimonadetes bacterium]|nr:HAMP domain-containing histidine kinase [Armatimonadota bacterium]
MRRTVEMGGRMNRIVAFHSNPAAARHEFSTVIPEAASLDVVDSLDALVRVEADLILADTAGAPPNEIMDRVPGRPVILVVPAEAVGAALARGAWGWTARPLDSETLKSMVAHALAEINLRRELKTARAALEVENEFRGKVVKTIAHDLQNALMGILGFAQLAQMSDDMAEKDHNMEDVVRSARIMREMMENVATFARLTTMEDQRREVSVASTAREIAGALKDHNTHVSLEAVEGDAQVYMDPRHLKQILVQVLQNAARYSTQGSVRVAVQARDDEALVSVEDQGMGIPAEFQERLFEPFYRAKRNDTSEIPGAGLGLSIASTLVERRGGRIWVESERGKGTRVYFTVPMNGGAR